MTTSAKKLEGGDCYEAAAKYVLDVNRKARVVHGRPTLTRPPFEKFGHAWVEYEHPVAGFTISLDVANGKHVEVPAVVYYAAGNIDPDECYHYDYEQLRTKLVEHKHWGPWEGPEAC